MATQALYYDAMLSDELLAVTRMDSSYAIGFVADSKADYDAGYAAGIASAPTDAVAPTVTAVTPIGNIAPSSEIVIDVDDDVAIGYAGVFVSVNRAPKQAVYRRGAFEAGFVVSSYVESLNGGKKQRLHIRPDSRWPNGTVAITVDPIDSKGNLGA